MKIYILIIVAFISFIVYGVFNQNRIDPKVKRVPCQNSVTTFEKIYSTDLKFAKELLLSSNYIIESKIEYSKSMKCNLYNIFSTSLAYTQIDTNNNPSDVNNSSDINEDQYIRRVGGYDSKKFVWNSQLELTNKLAVDYTLNAVKGTNVLDSSNNEIKRAGYTTHDVSMKYKLNSDWTLFVAVNNLTNKQYAKSTTISTKNQSNIYRYEMGRDYRFALKYEF